MRIHYLNHASIIIESGNVKLLFDPWFFGTCFEDGWGLRYDNPSALDHAKECTHLWISHFHQDHFHVPTLKRILELNPDIIAYGNNSYNFQLDSALTRIGFQNVIKFFEKKTIHLSPDVTITRFPTTGIDNMLLVRTPEGTVLNYNDCNVPAVTQRMLKKRIGHVDVLLTNFNHAGKLMLYPYPQDEVIKRKLKACFADNYTIFDPDFVLPFASYHYYRAIESQPQNTSMLIADDLKDLSEKIVTWKIGDTVELDAAKHELRVVSHDAVDAGAQQIINHASHYTAEQLIEAGNAYTKNLRKLYGPLTLILPILLIKVSDTGTTLQLSPRKGLSLAPEVAVAHITAHSNAIYKWFTKIYGTDSFAVGAHFGISDKNKVPLKWELALGMLVDNKLSLRHILTMMFTKSGLKFLWNRKEEIFGIVTRFRLIPEYHKED